MGQPIIYVFCTQRVCRCVYVHVCDNDRHSLFISCAVCPVTTATLLLVDNGGLGSGVGWGGVKGCWWCFYFFTQL